MESTRSMCFSILGFTYIYIFVYIERDVKVHRGRTVCILVEKETGRNISDSSLGWSFAGNDERPVC